MRMMDYADVLLVVKTIVDSDVCVDHIESDDNYHIEKLTDTIFKKVREEQIKQRHSITDGVADTRKSEAE